MKDIRDFSDPEFIKQAKSALESDGFLTDEHAFAPYRETIFEHAQEIANLLQESGFRGGAIKAGQIDHPYASKSYFLFDSVKLPGQLARDAVKQWLDERYKEPA
jgi:hypothetical protein